MNGDDDDRAINRFVAGLPVDEDALDGAISAHAVDRMIIVEALVGALDSMEATARLRAAERIARMPDIARPVAGALTRLVVADADLDVRAAAAAALRTHGEPVPGEPARRRAAPQSTEAPVLGRTASRLSVALRRVAFRSGDEAITLLLLPIDRADVPVRGRARLGDGDRWSVTIDGLGAEFMGTYPRLWVLDADGTPFVLGTAADPVAADGSVTIAVRAEAGSAIDVQRMLSGRVELNVPDD